MAVPKALITAGQTAACILFCILPVAGQTTIHSSLQGHVVDPQRAAVSGAVVTLTNSETNAQLVTRTDQVGQYTFPRVAPGTYDLFVEKEGFRRAISARIGISVNDAAVADVELSLGTVSEEVKVEAASSIVQSQSVEISSIIDERRVRELPLNGKNFQRLVLLAPGVGGGSATNPSVTGARPFTNSYTLDGATTNDERAQTGLSVGGGGAAGFTTASPNLISTEAIGEFNVITSNADATFGRGSGGQINIVTKSGANKLHGSTYYFGRNNALDARDFFNRGPFFNKEGRPVVPPFHQHLYGASISGPIHKDRHFYFGGFEGFRQKLEQTSSATVPNAALISLIPGDLQRLYRMFYIDRGVIPAQGNPPGGFAPLPQATRDAAIAAGFPASSINQAGTILLSTT
ncbi:MAG TPA: carboxypeptidase regulatory-like domain-containing protein, partial [Candidatus Acidoferrales bacterium]|nr:carboxypeptidase regulatory-like domain-containing protein [Candidatus Acidoferrales bacterium]